MAVRPPHADRRRPGPPCDQVLDGYIPELLCLGPIFEGWTLLAALAAQTRRLRLGLMVTSNRFRPPAVLAKTATTVDVVFGGRLDFGIGAGSRPSVPIARRE